MEFNEYKGNLISKIGFGCAALSGEGGGYGFGSLDKKESSLLVDMSIDYGVNLFDNAPIYGFGEAELKLGEALVSKREKAFIISKCGVNWHENHRVNMTNDPDKCLAQLHDSLKRLKTDYLDLYMVHWPDRNIDIRETMKPLLEAKKQGKIRYLGLSNPSRDDLDLVLPDIDFLQAESNLFNSGYNNISESLLKGLYTTSWGTFDKGVLSGSVKEDSRFDQHDCRSWAPWWKKSNWKEKVKSTKILHAYLEKYKIDKISYLIQFNLRYKNIDTVLCGFNKIKYLESMKTVFDQKIKTEHFEYGDSLF